MIAYLKGKIIHARFGQLIIETKGVGYRVNVNPQIKIPENCVEINYQVELFVHEHIREDCYDLYGFLNYAELEMFEKLISVSGVGPKAGLNIMASADIQKIYVAIENSDISFFTSISGIGKKVATKIILELKTKINESDSQQILSEEGIDSSVSDALVALGYKKHEIHGFITKIPKEIIRSEDKIKWLLKNFK